MEDCTESEEWFTASRKDVGEFSGSLSCCLSAEGMPLVSWKWICSDPKPILKDGEKKNPCWESNLQQSSAHPVAPTDCRCSSYSMASWETRGWLQVRRRMFARRYDVSKLALVYQTLAGTYRVTVSILCAHYLCTKRRHNWRSPIASHISLLNECVRFRVLTAIDVKDGLILRRKQSTRSQLNFVLGIYIERCRANLNFDHAVHTMEQS